MNEPIKYAAWEWRMAIEANRDRKFTMILPDRDYAQYTYAVVQKLEQQSADQETRDSHDDTSKIAFE